MSLFKDLAIIDSYLKWLGYLFSESSDLIIHEIDSVDASVKNVRQNDRTFVIRDIDCYAIERDPLYVTQFADMTGNNLLEVSSITLTVVFSSHLREVSIEFGNGLKLYADILTRATGRSRGISYTDDWREFIKYYDESNTTLEARFKSYVSDRCELELKSTGNFVNMNAEGGNAFHPVKLVVASFSFPYDP